MSGTASQDAALLAVSGLSVAFATESGPVTAVRDVSFEVRPGEVVSIVGESGSGKTVSLLGILGLTDPRNTTVQGAVAFRGRRLLELSDRAMRGIRGREIALVSQDPMTALTPVYTIGYQIAEQIRAHERVSRSEARRRAIVLLGEVGLPAPTELVDRYPHQLSGGMRQRAVIAMALSCNPALLVADEPTTALDVTVQAQILDLLRRLRHQHGSAVVLITHDMGVVGEMADRVLVMYAGSIVEAGTARQIFEDPWHPYTWGLLASIPPLRGRRPRRLASIPGTPPSLAHPPQGCAFRPRCRFAHPACLAPPPRTGAGEHSALCVIPAEERPALRAAVLAERGEAA